MVTGLALVNSGVLHSHISHFFHFIDLDGLVNFAVMIT